MRFGYWDSLSALCFVHLTAQCNLGLPVRAFIKGTVHIAGLRLPLKQGLLSMCLRCRRIRSAYLGGLDFRHEVKLLELAHVVACDDVLEGIRDEVALLHVDAVGRLQSVALVLSGELLHDGAEMLVDLLLRRA